MRPIYAGAQDEKFDSKGNRGLWYTRFFDRYGTDHLLDEDAKRAWVSDNAHRTGNSAALDAHAARQQALVTALDGRTRMFATDWHFATGLGLPHPVENGLNWHHTLGVPYLPGSGVKGLVRAWVECWDESLGALDSEARQARIADWFGTVNDRDGSGTAGRFVFFDALPVAPLELAADVMTPHMGKWYEQGDVLESARDAERVPADWHDPVPVPFLVVKSAQFLFGVAPRPGQSADGLDEVLQALEHALGWLGAGAKTAVGYGRFMPVESGIPDQAPADAITIATETWQGALIEWEGGGAGKLTAYEQGDQKRKAVLIGTKAKSMQTGLSAGQLKKLKSRQLRRDVVVEVHGNQITITSWAPESSS